LSPNTNLGDAAVTLEDKVHAFRLRLFQRAEELGNISAACREAGISRSLYYQLRGRFQRYGSDGLHPKHRQGRPGRPPLLDAQIERRILASRAGGEPLERDQSIPPPEMFVESHAILSTFSRIRLFTDLRDA
jgi:hypothetical protein